MIFQNPSAIMWELMGQAVDNLKCMQPENVVQPVDAQIQDTGDTFEIIPEVMGNALIALRRRK